MMSCLGLDPTVGVKRKGRCQPPEPGENSGCKSTEAGPEVGRAAGDLQ